MANYKGRKRMTIRKTTSIKATDTVVLRGSEEPPIRARVKRTFVTQNIPFAARFRIGGSKAKKNNPCKAPSALEPKPSTSTEQSTPSTETTGTSKDLQDAQVKPKRLFAEEAGGINPSKETSIQQENNTYTKVSTQTPTSQPTQVPGMYELKELALIRNGKMRVILENTEIFATDTVVLKGSEKWPIRAKVERTLKKHEILFARFKQGRRKVKVITPHNAPSASKPVSSTSTEVLSTPSPATAPQTKRRRLGDEEGGNNPSGEATTHKHLAEQGADTGADTKVSPQT